VHRPDRPRDASAAAEAGRLTADGGPAADAPATRHRLAAGRADAGQRLDVVLARQFDTMSRAQVQRLIRDGHVRVSGARAKPSLAVEEGAVIEIDVPAPAAPAPAAEPLPLSVIHDDPDIVVIDKPAGLVVHPGAGHPRGTLVNALLHHVGGLSGIGGRERPGIVHRLDRGTSGVMVVAKHDRAHQALSRQFHDRRVRKEYVALVWGRLAPGARIEHPIGRHPRHRQKMSTRARRTRSAVTEILDVRPLGEVSLVRLSIGTGRTHQIRVHLSEEHHPVVGDALYGGVRRPLPASLSALGSLTRPFLHAARLSFVHPGTGETVAYEAPLAPDLASVLARLGVAP
jgi:23S rRNA pseudouridine1911/1915/1917 synthase